MISRSRAQRLAEYLIRRACRRLPVESRDDRYREWTAELHAILHDPGTRRSLRAIAYAVGHTSSTRRLARAVGQRGQRFHVSVDRLTPAAIMVSATGTATGVAILIWSPAQQGLAGWIFTGSMTVAAVFSVCRTEWGWRRPRWPASAAQAGRARRTRYQAAHAGRRKRVLLVRDNWLLLAGVALSTAGTVSGLALQIWSPYQGLSGAVFASSITASLALVWRARRRERPEVR
jgi:hypothetical protein